MSKARNHAGSARGGTGEVIRKVDGFWIKYDNLANGMPCCVGCVG